MRKIYLTFLFLFLLGMGMQAQKTSLKGIVLNSSTKQPVKGISVQLENQGLSSFTESDGAFYFEGINPGTDVIIISSPDVKTRKVQMNIVSGEVNDAGTVLIDENSKNLLIEGSLILLDEETVGEESDQGNYNISSLMTYSNDVYLSNVGYNFGAIRYRVRGYDQRYSSVYINGVKFNDTERGVFSYGMIGGLNDAMRNQDVTNSLYPSTYSYSQIGGSTNINTSATNYTPGGKASFAYTNRNYKLRAMATYSTGLMDNGWAVTGSMGYRWADEGYVEGTFYNSLGYFLSIEKVINPEHRISLTTFGSPTQRGQQAAAIQEAYDLTDNNLYNPNWGYQNGEKRNARIVTAYEPTAILSHTWQINKDNKLTTGLGGKYTRYGGTALNWYKAADPRPDYYRNFPSYITDQEEKDKCALLWQTNPSKSQIDWYEFYRENDLNNIKGEGATYMVEERRNDQLALNINSALTSKLTDKITLNAGFEAGITKGIHFKTMNDLLGAEYFTDLDQFAERDRPEDTNILQNDLNNPNRKIEKGDKFGYDYDIYVNTANIWLQNSHRYSKWDVYYGFNLKYTEFWRNGNMRNGRAPENSYGKGDVHSFVSQGAKLGLAYKLSGRHIINGNISYATQPPIAYDAYLSARIKDNVVPNLQNEQIFSADINYNITTPLVRGRISAFQTNFYDQTELTSFYYDPSNTFVNFALSGVNKMHRGIEVGIEGKINSSVSVSLVGTLAEYIYTNRPTGTISYENGMYQDETTTVYYKNFYVGGTPQTAGSLGVHYFHPKYWFIDLTFSAFDRNYIELSPTRRTSQAVAFTDDSYEDKVAKAEAITHQEKFAGATTLDFSIGKLIRIQRKYQLNINLQFCNILNNTNIKSGGYEQSRFDFANYNVNRFPNRYYYAQGFNCFLMAGFRF